MGVLSDDPSRPIRDKRFGFRLIVQRDLELELRFNRRLQGTIVIYQDFEISRGITLFTGAESRLQNADRYRKKLSKNFLSKNLFSYEMHFLFIIIQVRFHLPGKVNFLEEISL